MKVSEHVFARVRSASGSSSWGLFSVGRWWPGALARTEEALYRRAEADSVPRTEERYPEQPAALAASDTPDGSS